MKNEKEIGILMKNTLPYKLRNVEGEKVDDLLKLRVLKYKLYFQNILCCLG